tara:strand:+ start:320 stop:529 length:210 start_codon:yes stop_codon:yes gene_type:complete
MRNHYNETPLDAARGELLNVLEKMAKQDEDRNPYVETPSFNRAKRKHLAKIYYKLVDQWDLDTGAVLET